jgi:Mg-chelatase subunit ChlD
MFSFLNGPGSSAKSTDTPLDGENKESDRPVDILFLQDTTGSQGPYINSARKAICDICDKISASADIKKELIRFGLIAFRDHPPQDMSYVTKNFGFTDNISTMQANLNRLTATGGGDGPEAQTAALAAALDMEWVDNAVKMVVLITDAPPHGIGEDGDGFTKSPDQNDPLEIARQMAERGITLFVIACEPALSRYKNAVDFYTALTQLTSGKMFSLMMADKLGDYIVGTAIETIETEKLIKEFENVIVDDVYGAGTSIDKVTNDLQEKLNKKGLKLNTMTVDNIYNENPVTKANTNIWYSAKNVSDAGKLISPSPGPRMQGLYSSYAKTPSVSIAPQAISPQQAQHVVMSSIARQSVVTSEGMHSRGLDGKSVSSAFYQPFDKV